MSQQPVNILGKCPYCGAPNRSGSRFCEYCGSWIGADSTYPESDAHSADERSVNRESRNDLPGWDTGIETGTAAPNSNATQPGRTASSFAFNSEPVSIPEANPQNQQNPNIFRKWKFFFPVWSVFCLLFSFLPFLNNSSDEALMTFILVWIPGIILFAINRHRKFRPPHWIFLIVELCLICFVLLLTTIGRWANSPHRILSETFCYISLILCPVIFIGGIIWKKRSRS